MMFWYKKSNFLISYLDSELRQLKKSLDEKNAYIDQIHVQLTRSNTVIKYLFKYLYNLKGFK
jgi:hypothetical protein